MNPHEHYIQALALIARHLKELAVTLREIADASPDVQRLRDDRQRRDRVSRMNEEARR